MLQAEAGGSGSALRPKKAADDGTGDDNPQHEDNLGSVASSLTSSEPQPASSPLEGSQNDTVIDGLRPKNVLRIGQSIKIQKLPKLPAFTITRRKVFMYTCTCQQFNLDHKTAPPLRSCDHLREYLGESYEEARAHKMRSVLFPPDAGNKSKEPAKRQLERDDSTSQIGMDKKVGYEPKLMRGIDMPKQGFDPRGWWMSEKLDGVRAYWDGDKLISRRGLIYLAPDKFRAKLPKDQLDGELWIKRDHFNETSGFVRRQWGAKLQKTTEEKLSWDDVIFFVFDTIDRGAQRPLEDRWDSLKEKLGEPVTPDEAMMMEKGRARVLKQIKCEGMAHMKNYEQSVVDKGGEGIMLRKPKSLYQPGKSNSVYKLKRWYDAEGRVEGYNHGKDGSKYQHSTGSLKLKMEVPKTFDISSGMTDWDRDNPPAIGTIVKYKFQEISKDGFPRFPIYIGVAADATGPKDAIVRSTALRNRDKNEE